jgi:hypothetical protein
VSFINSRLRRLEERAGSGQCSECAGQQGIVVAYDEATARRALDSSASCPRCGRAVTVIRVVYDGDEDEGEGVLARCAAPQ